MAGTATLGLRVRACTVPRQVCARLMVRHNTQIVGVPRSSATVVLSDLGAMRLWRLWLCMVHGCRG